MKVSPQTLLRSTIDEVNLLIHLRNININKAIAGNMKSSTPGISFKVHQELRDNHAQTQQYH